jgi:hypothetical protein
MSNKFEYPGPFRNTVPGNIDDWYGPYADAAAAVSAIPSGMRVQRTIGIITGATIEEYWWPGADLTATGLVKKADGRDLGLKENTANKSQAISTSTTLYPSAKAVQDHVSDNKSINTTVAGLRAITNPKTDVIYQTSDYGGGQWFYDATDTTSADNTGTILVSTNGKRYKRPHDSDLSVRWFGALGDGINEDSAGINAALAFANSIGGGSVYLPAGNYRTTQFIFIKGNNITLRGDGNASKIIAYNPTQTEDVGLSVLVVNYHTDYYSADKRISNIILKDFSIDQSNITPVYLNKWIPADPAGESKYYGVSQACVSIQAVDHIRVNNVNVFDSTLGGFLVQGCYDLAFEDNGVYGVRNVRYSTTLQGAMYNGNCFTIRGTTPGNPTTTPPQLNAYTGPIGAYYVKNNTAVGKVGTFPSSPMTNQVIDDAANIGFDFVSGAIAPTQRTTKNFIVQGNSAINCIAGILIEGLNDGGTGDLICDGNTLDNNLYGIQLYGNTTTNLDNSNDVTISNNRITNTYYSAISGFGNNALVSNNQIINWGTNQTGGYIDNTFSNTASAAIYWRPLGFDVTAALSVKGLVIDGNICINKYVNTSAYYRSIAGIYLDTRYDNQVISGVSVSNNYLNGGAATSGSTTNVAYGITTAGKWEDISYNNNTITGFPLGAMYLKSINSSDGTQSPTRVKISNSKMFDNGTIAGANGRAAIKIETSRNHYTIENCELYETSGTRIGTAVTLTNEVGAATTANYFTIRGLKCAGLAFGNTHTINLNTTGVNIVIENVSDYSYRATIPVSGYKGFTGTIVYNTNPSTGIAYWVCTATGTPGTWVPVMTKSYIDTSDDLKENLLNKATDFTVVNNNLYPTVQAAKNYADNLVVGLLNDRGTYDASTNAYPSTGGSGTSGAILKGNVWSISVAGTLAGIAVNVGDWLRALTNTPGQTAANWGILEGNFGYVVENSSNKTDTVSNSTTLYPSAKAVQDYVDAGDALKLNKSGGALTGLLSGTSADFSGNVTAATATTANHVVIKSQLDSKVDKNGFVAAIDNMNNPITSTTVGGSVRANSVSGGLNFPFSLGQVFTFNGNGDAARALTICYPKSDVGLGLFIIRHNSDGTFNSINELSYKGNGLLLGYRAITAATTVLPTTDYTINITSGTFTQTLPNAPAKTVFAIKNSGSGVITVSATSIDGASTYVLPADSKQSIRVQAVDGSGNYIII